MIVSCALWIADRNCSATAMMTAPARSTRARGRSGRGRTAALSASVDSGERDQHGQRHQWSGRIAWPNPTRAAAASNAGVLPLTPPPPARLVAKPTPGADARCARPPRRAARAHDRRAARRRPAGRRAHLPPDQDGEVPEAAERPPELHPHLTSKLPHRARPGPQSAQDPHAARSGQRLHRLCHGPRGLQREKAQINFAAMTQLTSSHESTFNYGSEAAGSGSRRRGRAGHDGCQRFIERPPPASQLTIASAAVPAFDCRTDWRTDLSQRLRYQSNHVPSRVPDCAILTCSNSIEPALKRPYLRQCPANRQLVMKGSPVRAPGVGCSQVAFCGVAR